MISPLDSALLIIDVQDRLMPVISSSVEVSTSVSVLAQGMNILNVPIVCTEQYPERLGATVDAVQSVIGVEKISKISFSCCGVAEFNTALDSLGRKNILVCGVETHVCVYQTVMDLLEKGYQPYIIDDAISSRNPKSKEVAMRRMIAEGAKIATVEMVLFELLGAAGGDLFKQILKLIK